MQVDVPMVPFWEETLVDLITPFMKMVVKSDVLEEANTSLKLIKIDLTKAENLLPCELIKLPTATKDLLKSSLLKSDKKRLFKNDCKAMIIAIYRKFKINVLSSTLLLVLPPLFHHHKWLATKRNVMILFVGL